MKKHFGFNSKKPVLFRDSSTSPCGEGGNGVNQQSGYHIRDKDLGKIHRAACEGNVARVQQILLLRKNGPNDKDKRNRLSSASKKNVPVFCWNMVPTQISWMSRATRPSTMLSLVRISPSQQSCFRTRLTLKQETRYGSTNFIFFSFVSFVFCCCCCYFLGRSRGI
uniref:Uncharacterized protein n=1 Tax=Sus scrofa TaxID=9823 RepID=A0A8D0X7Z4_PIG